MAKTVKKSRNQTSKPQNSVKRATRPSSVETKSPSVKKTAVVKTTSVKSHALPHKLSDKKKKNGILKNQGKTTVHKKATSFSKELAVKSREKKKTSVENPSRSKNTNALAGNVKPISGERRTKEVRPEELREALLNRRHSILKWMDDDIDQEKTNDGGIVGDVVDAAQGSNENEMAFQLAEVESRELGQINIALGKIGDGSYGICEDCNGKISPARLKALPFATKCIKCQEAYDETQSGSGSQDSWGSAFRGSSSGDDHSAQEMD